VDSVRVAPEEVALPPAGIAGRRVIVLIPMTRMSRPEERADAIVYLASDSAGYITGQTLRVNGGLNTL